MTLETHLRADNGLKCLKGYPDLSTNIFVYVADCDITSSYPKGGIAFGVESATTKIEPCRVEGVRENIRRRASINITAPRENGYEICRDIMKAKPFDTVLEAYREYKKKVAA